MDINAWLDAPPLWIALLPLGIYLLLLTAAHLRRRPTVVSGTWDGIVLAAAVAGLAAAGPLALVRPAVGSSLWGWVIVVLIFCLVVAMCILAARPRLVIYNISTEQLRPLVAEVVAVLDGDARWAGASVALPARGLQVHLDGAGGMRCASVIAGGERAAPEAWTEFGRRLRQALARLRVRPSPWAAAFATAAVAVLAAAAWAARG